MSNFIKRIEADYLPQLNIFKLRRMFGWRGMVEQRLQFGENIFIGIQSYPMNNYQKFIEGVEKMEGDGYLRIFYFIGNRGEEPKKFDYKVFFTATACNLSGKRYWFLCPDCNRRVGVLYLRADTFACRYCNYLTYTSRNLSGHWRWAGKIISAPEVDEARKAVKRPYYRGKLTRKAQRCLRLARKFKQVFTRNTLTISGWNKEDIESYLANPDPHRLDNSS